jgi:hypothetical protein
MTTWHDLYERSTLAYNQQAFWRRRHDARHWIVATDDSRHHAVIDDFGTLVPID